MNTIFAEERLTRRSTLHGLREAFSVEKQREPLSPIDLHTLKAKVTHNEPFQFIGFNKELFPEILNDGYSVNMNYKSEPRPRVFGGGLKYPEYMVYNIHFHWDSEHTVNGVRFALECHLKMMGTQFRSRREAVDKKGLASLSSLWKYSKEENTSLKTLFACHDAIAKHPKIPAWPTRPIVISQLIPENTNNYFRYDGSASAPPYFETTNTVFIERVHFTRKQMSILTDICNEVGDPIVYNSAEIVRSITPPIVYFNGDKNSCRCLKLP
ncbi:hypothetical protein WA026_011862 [Henosepilachna vigintioctopunctata]|uniref:carbonic anhydrase n=1 Tax=Henosepilachna vigintioctopunctata TaxID=420089 RepID=A0AAW1ULH8_9CUCU